MVRTRSTASLNAFQKAVGRGGTRPYPIQSTFHHSTTPSLHHSTTPTFQHSNTPTFQHSNIPSLQHSNTPTFHHSTTPPPLHYPNSSLLMLTQLSTVKARLGIGDFDLQYDAILTNAIKAITARFD